MKFAYVDESGDAGQTSVFVMAALLVDAYRLRRITADFDQILRALLDRHPGSPKELKTKAFIGGRGGWSEVPGDERKAFLRSLCELAARDGKVFASAICLNRFDEMKSAELASVTKNHYWHAAAMFVASMIQKRLQSEPNNKGLTVLVMDNNQQSMPALSDAIHVADPWFDGLYQVQEKKRGKTVWKARSAADRFDAIVNTAFAIRSNHSSLVQVADALAYVYRRWLELQAEDETYTGERGYYQSLFELIDAQRKSIGRCPDCDAVKLYKAVAPQGWKP
ncbi:MAG: DUF3800 domain-containing protein [Pseudomonadota bacterium]